MSSRRLTVREHVSGSHELVSPTGLPSQTLIDRVA